MPCSSSRWSSISSIIGCTGWSTQTRFSGRASPSSLRRIRQRHIGRTFAFYRTVSYAIIRDGADGDPVRASPVTIAAIDRCLDSTTLCTSTSRSVSDGGGGCWPVRNITGSIIRPEPNTSERIMRCGFRCGTSVGTAYRRSRVNIRTLAWTGGRPLDDARRFCCRLSTGQAWFGSAPKRRTPATCNILICALRHHVAVPADQIASILRDGESLEAARWVIRKDLKILPVMGLCDGDRASRTRKNTTKKRHVNPSSKGADMSAPSHAGPSAAAVDAVGKKPNCEHLFDDGHDGGRLRTSDVVHVRGRARGRVFLRAMRFDPRT